MPVSGRSEVGVNPADLRLREILVEGFFKISCSQARQQTSIYISCNGH